MSAHTPRIGNRFRGFLPVVVDVETGGFDAAANALLEVAAVLVEFSADGLLRRGRTLWHHVQPFAGSRVDAASLAVNGIDPWHPLRPAIPEHDALARIFREIRTSVREQDCTRAILVGHNSAFDLAFINAAASRAGIKRNPFHPFSSFDTATLAGVAYGQTVLSRAVVAAGMEWDAAAAHSAAYDAERTADLFCAICNEFRPLYESGLERLSARGPAVDADPNPMVEPEAEGPGEG